MLPSRVTRRSQRLALRAERPDTAVIAESARRSSFALRADGSCRSAATARRWTSSRASGNAMASSSHVRSRADRNTHMLPVPSLYFPAWRPGTSRPALMSVVPGSPGACRGACLCHNPPRWTLGCALTVCRLRHALCIEGRTTSPSSQEVCPPMQRWRLLRLHLTARCDILLSGNLLVCGTAKEYPDDRQGARGRRIHAGHVR
jgi:hypothetical protein